MKKILMIALAGLVALLILALVAVALGLDSAVKKAVETFGPQYTKVAVKLDSVKLSLLSGTGTLSGFSIGNPQPYTTSNLMSVGRTHVELKPLSLFSDKLIIRTIQLDAPEITVEGGLNENNLTKLMKNVQDATGGAAPSPSAPAPSGPSKKLQVDHFRITGGRLHVKLDLMGGTARTVPLPDIELSALGAGPQGITAAELTRQVLGSVSATSLVAVARSAGDIGKDILKNANKSSEDLKKSTQGVKDLFKRK